MDAVGWFWVVRAIGQRKVRYPFDVFLEKKEKLIHERIILRHFA